MHKYDYDVVIVGAGPAGLMTARELARKSIKVLLLDAKESVEKVHYYTLGSFMNVAAFELSERCIAQKTTICRISSPRTTFEKNISILVLDKIQLHKELLAQAIKAGAGVMYKALAKNIFLSDSGAIESIEVVLGSVPRKFTAKYFIDATGPNAFLAKKIGLVAKDRIVGTAVEYEVELKKNPHVLHLFVGEQFGDGYGWIFPMGKNRAVIGWTVNMPEFIPKIQKYLSWLFERQDVKEYITKTSDRALGGTGPSTGQEKKFFKANLVLVGDSAGQLNPFIGEGYRFILDSAVRASKYIALAVMSGENKYLQHYQDEWERRYMASYQRALISQKIFRFLARSGFSPNTVIFINKFLPAWLVGRFVAAKL